MSAIWGMISLEKDLDKRNKEIEECRIKMKQPYEECVIDRFEEKTFSNGFFASGIQYFKGNSDKETLPVMDEERGFVFTGDVVLNDRKGLIAELENAQDMAFMDKDSLEDATDGTLAYFAFRVWEDSFVEHIQGLFAIAVYDLKKGCFKLFSDHVGARCVYYCISGQQLFFSTLIKPILKVMPKELYGLNERFIVGCESTSVPLMFVFPELTAFDNVYLVPMASCLRAEAKDGEAFEYSVREYWNPTSKKWLKNKEKYSTSSDRQLREEFRRIFSTCVRDAVDTDGEIAATMSSGLDSASVATVAARLLPENKKVYAYTSIPILSHERSKGGYYIEDETEGVKAIVSGYDNIIQSSESCEGVSAFTEMDKFTHRYEIPGKAYINHIWMDHIAVMARKGGCKVLLTGQFGNYTISNGNILERFFQELYKGHFGEAKRQLAAFGKRYGVSRKNLLGMVLDELGAKVAFSLGFTKDFDEIFDERYVRQDLIRKYGIKKEIRKSFRKYGYTAVNSAEKMTGHMFNFNILQTQGMYDTKLSLYTGILLRDPTRDKRMIELCSLLPSSQFVNDGIERRLVREYLDDYIPDKIRMDVWHRGLQSADMAERLQQNGAEKMQTEFNKELGRFLNEDKARELMKQEISKENAFDIVRILALNSFVNKYEKRSHN